MMHRLAIFTFTFSVLTTSLITACDNVQSEFTQLSDNSYSVRIKAEDDGSGAQFMQALHQFGTELCDGPFEPIGAAHMDAGFPILQYPVLLVDIKCGPSNYPDTLLKTLSKTRSRTNTN